MSGEIDPGIKMAFSEDSGVISVSLVDAARHIPPPDPETIVFVSFEVPGQGWLDLLDQHKAQAAAAPEE